MRVLLSDEQILVLEGLRNLLEARGIEVVDVAQSCRECIEKARELRPDIILMDTGTCRAEGLEGSCDAARNCEPHGEIGLITPRDGEIWRDQSGAPTDPQAGNIPAGRRDILRTANFNDGTLQAFSADTGYWTVSNAVLNVAAESLGGDAAAVFYLDQALPAYYEISASVSVLKPTAGWKANAYLIFDYVSPTDFKFAGLDSSVNKVVMGHRTADGWIYDVQAPMLVKQNQFYTLLVVVNGLQVTALVDGVSKLTYQFAPRNVDGIWYGLEYGLVGVGSDNSRGAFDNYTVSVLPPVTAFEHTDDFAGGTSDLFGGAGTGTWSVTDGRYVGTVTTGWATSLLELPPHPAGTDVELEALLGIEAGSRAGFVFDRYADDDYKFVAFDRSAGTLTFGHVIRNKQVVDGVVAMVLAAGDLAVKVALSGTTVTVSVNGVSAGSFSYFSGILDGGLGALVAGGRASFDDVRVFIGTHFIKVVDATAPVVTPPKDVTTEVGPGQATVYIADTTLGSATASDNTLLESLVRSGVPAGNLFPIGVTLITWTATDVFGNVTYATQMVTVYDRQAPVLVVPPSISREIPLGQTSVTLTSVELGTATASDNSGSVTVTSSGIPAGLVFPLGVTTITWTATDPSGNVTKATQTVTVTNPLPVVSIVATDARGAEAGPDSLTFVVSRSFTYGSITVGLTWSGEAGYGVDYQVVATGGTLVGGSTLVFDASAASVTLTVTPVADLVTEAAESVLLTLVAGSGYTRSARRRARSRASTRTPPLPTRAPSSSRRPTPRGPRRATRSRSP